MKITFDLNPIAARQFAGFLSESSSCMAEDGEGEHFKETITLVHAAVMKAIRGQSAKVEKER